MRDPDTVRHAARTAAAEVAGGAVADDEPLISSGRIDSLAIVRLIARLEQLLGVSIPAGSVQPDDFDTVNWIVDTIARVAAPE
jgi:acyl carrier protein